MAPDSNSREQWSGKIGFILSAIGSAVGLGSIWRFPFVTGENGGGAFVLIYVVCVLLLGLPVLLSEIVLGRSTQRNPVGALRKRAPGTPWFLGGFIGITGTIIILAFYSTVGGWTLSYIWGALADGFGQMSIQQAEARFTQFISDPIIPILWQFLFMMLTMGICLFGLQNGIERTNKFLMPMLGIMLIILVIRGITLPGSGEGIRFILYPDWSSVTFNTVFEALGMAFFSLSIGAGTMVTYGSYLPKKESIPHAVKHVVLFSTLVSLAAGLAIFPAIFSLGYEPNTGPPLVYITLPAVFAQMPGGSLFAILFFFLLSVAALTSSISLLEVPLRYLEDEHGFSRKKGTLLAGGLIFLLGIFATLSFSTLSHVKGIAGLPIFESMDFIASNVLLPLGGLVFILFAGWKWGIRQVFDAAKGEDGKGLPAQLFWEWIARWVTPVLILIVFLFQVLSNL
ncbi:MAG: sodium-dependent transporter [Firmicutes bacterium]|uniref:Transporter n=1 Tax=Melghirimyces thermohalophilus TaxID=1236220 RepID=A0A1G6HNP0_9BACL|nr:sodium-dependent transporter [Melghirimyces thermohalophilus]MDA8351960.1 sodium-dependent transporter [Bacillota bacterium]SDB95804.1 neurotransmitter:Na+ symporter, NSS family [Melghirimyces thermohalophilus]